ncbi:N-acylglucosamine 2-epimerase isoform X10 [Patagioenas fasciata]|uniref:N-acylglucosamine 2-epimerase isoform X8 n=1 Tax=Patagioenas fasciata TaxID=372321 RepID=UPI003A995F43
MVSLSEWRERVAAALDETLGFWERHSHDPEHGGFFSCLSRDGSVYDDTKYVWMQGRQIWVYSRLYRTFPRFRRPELLEAARAAGEFLLRCARLRPGSPRVAFALSRAGTPLRLQRAPYSELFCAMGLDELGRATGEARYRAEARQWVLAVWGWVRGAPQEWGPPRVPGCPPRQSFGVPMMLLALGLQLLEGGGGDPQIEAVAEWGAQRLLLHLQHGGLFAFLDADGLCPTQLEWPMKLWWPHAEAMVALLAAQRFEPRPRLLRQFQRVGTFLFDKFRDPEHGEWFGYLTREGNVALTIKGGPYKGCFHMARALMMCEELLGELLERGDTLDPPQ